MKLSLASVIIDGNPTSFLLTAMAWADPNHEAWETVQWFRDRRYASTVVDALPGDSEWSIHSRANGKSTSVPFSVSRAKRVA